MMQQHSSCQMRMSNLGTFSSGVFNQDYTTLSNQKTSNSDGWQKAVVIGTALTAAFVGLPSNATESNSVLHESFYSSVQHVQSVNKVILLERVSNTIPWLNDFYKSAKNVSKAKQIYPLVSGIRGLFANQEYGIVDDILSEMDHQKLSHTAMVAFITSTFPARDKLSNWSLSAERVKLSLEKDGLDSNSILQGLI